MLDDHEPSAIAGSAASADAATISVPIAPAMSLPFACIAMPSFVFGLIPSQQIRVLWLFGEPIIPHTMIVRLGETFGQVPVSGVAGCPSA